MDEYEEWLMEVMKVFTTYLMSSKGEGMKCGVIERVKNNKQNNQNNGRRAPTSYQTSDCRCWCKTQFKH